ncbi:MAG TPA: hypothetical protein VGM56_23290 [Byssovorax sp.]|jgi:hypothetical protein
MPRTAEDVENYLLQLDRQFENDGGTFLVGGPTKTPIAIRVAPPIVAIRVSIGEIPAAPADQLKVFRRMLEYNATDLMHISYGVDRDGIVLTAALELENLDLNELEAALSDVDLALARHMPELIAAAAFEKR